MFDDGFNLNRVTFSPGAVRFSGCFFAYLGAGIVGESEALRLELPVVRLTLEGFVAKIEQEVAT